MKPARIDPPAVRIVTVVIDEDQASAAEALGLDVAATCRLGFDAQLRRTRRAAIWQDRNREAIEGMNAWVEKNGLPLEKYRSF